MQTIPINDYLIQTHLLFLANECNDPVVQLHLHACLTNVSHKKNQDTVNQFERVHCFGRIIPKYKLAYKHLDSHTCLVAKLQPLAKLSPSST